MDDDVVMESAQVMDFIDSHIMMTVAVFEYSYFLLFKSWFVKHDFDSSFHRPYDIQGKIAIFLKALSTTLIL